MATEIVMPRLGWNMETGSVGQWLKNNGDRVQAGEVIFTVEGDKAVQEVEALDSGILCLPPDSPPAEIGSAGRMGSAAIAVVGRSAGFALG